MVYFIDEGKVGASLWRISPLKYELDVVNDSCSLVRVIGCATGFKLSSIVFVEAFKF